MVRHFVFCDLFVTWLSTLMTRKLTITVSKLLFPESDVPSVLLTFTCPSYFLVLPIVYKVAAKVQSLQCKKITSLCIYTVNQTNRTLDSLTVCSFAKC